ncbi:MAG: alpha/beta fold hydrolase [Puia sp.]|nr:alpha/beta fold hydrolase [Puia sp.]
MNRKFLSYAFTLILFFCFGTLSAQEPGKEEDGAYQDLSHYSRVFGHDKLYRLYLPRGYAGSARRYPVIYFFHGWGGRHFKDDNAKLEYKKIKELVDQYQTILVMWDGNIDLSEPRPYNVGNHEDVKFNIQMKDYFPELVEHIDSAYRTLSDRTHRGIIGFSMGGFMSLFLAGKYPDKVCAAVSMAGSPEFFVGYPDNQELYPVRYTFINLRQVDTRIHNGNTDILYYLNSEVHEGALWDEQVNLQYWPFIGGHMVDRPGETKVFGSAMKFITESFKKRSAEAASAAGIKSRVAASATATASSAPATATPAAATSANLRPAAPFAPDSWSHYDLYPSFDLWGYQVTSDKRDPGFLFLKNTGQKGFGFYTYRWLPAGPSLPDVHATIVTAPRYIPFVTYHLARYKRSAGTVSFDSLKSDGEGRLLLDCGGAGEEIGVYRPTDDPEFVFLDYSLRGLHHYLPVGKTDELRIRLFNRGGENRLPSQIQIRIRTKDPSVKFADSTVTIKVYPGQRILELPSFVFSCNKKPPPHAEPADIRFHLTIGTPASSTRDEFTAPVFFQAPAFDSIRVDDGRLIRDTIMGSGNGNGIAEAGERVLLYQGSHRLRLYTEDPWVPPGKERLADEMIPGRWPDGFTLSSVVELSPDCPDGHTVEFLAGYETKTFNPIERKLTWGRVRLTVRHIAGNRRN